MSYTPTTWVTGDIITAEKLNNIESGVVSADAGSLFEIIESEEDNVIVVNKTKDEILEAITEGKRVVYVYPSTTDESESGYVLRVPLVSFLRARNDTEHTPTGDVIENNVLSFVGAVEFAAESGLTFAMVTLNTETMSVTKVEKTVNFDS